MSFPNFKHTTRLDLKSLLAKKSGDLEKVYWPDDEWNLYINEALLTYGAIAQAWKFPIQIKTQVGKSFYDISSELFTNQNLLVFELDYQFLINLINKHLFENLVDINSTSEITSTIEILKFARNRINLYQYLTSLVISKNTYNFVESGINQLIINDEVIDIIRVAYLINSKYYNLHKEDEQDIAFNDSKVFNTTKNIPDYYTTLLGSLNQIFVYPPPANLGQLEIISINGIASSILLALNTKIPLPNNLVPYLKYGILADIFSKEGIGQDLARASYCEERWREGLQIGINYSSILFAKLNSIPIQIDSLNSFDDQQNNWENEIGKPNLIGSVGYNLFATNRVPNDVYSIDIDCITNAYLPIDDNDFIDIKEEYIGSFANYCLHLANFKSGFAALKKTDGFRNTFVQGAISHNLRLLERGIDYISLMQKIKLQESEEAIRPKQIQSQT